MLGLRWLVWGSVLAIAGSLAPARAQQANVAVERGIAYLKAKVAGMPVGEAALTALTFNKANVPNNDPAIGSALKLIFSTFKPEGYEPVQRGGQDIYEAAVV